MDWLSLINKVLELFKTKKVESKLPNVPVVLSYYGTTLKLVRKTDNEWCTQGELTINDVFICFTIELPKISNNGAKVRVAAGTYTMSMYQGSKWPYKVPLLDTTSIGRTYIEIHPSNFAIRPSDGKVFLEGCIAPGLTQGEDYVNSSKLALDLILTKIDWTKPVRIIIFDL